MKKSSALSYDSVCGNIDGGASDTEIKLQDDDSTCNIASDPMQSPTTCFEPDPYVYYNFRATFQEDTSGELPYGENYKIFSVLRVLTFISYRRFWISFSEL